MASQQYVTLVAAGGTPILLANQAGAPHPTTGSGALVFSNGATLTNVTFDAASFSGPFGFAAGSVVAPGLYFIGDAETGIYQTATGHVSVTCAGVAMADVSAAGFAIYAAPILPYREIASGSTVTMTARDFEVGINKSVSGATTVKLPGSPVAGQLARVTDVKGDLDIGVNNITVTGANGTELINGASSLVMNAAYSSTTFRWSGSKWSIV